MDVNFLVAILCYSNARYYHQRKLGERYMRYLCIISYIWTWTYNYLKMKVHPNNLLFPQNYPISPWMVNEVHLHSWITHTWPLPAAHTLFSWDILCQDLISTDRSESIGLKWKIITTLQTKLGFFSIEK